MLFLRYVFKLAGVAVAFLTIGEMSGAWGQLGVIQPAQGAEHVARVTVLGLAAAILYGIGSACRPRVARRRVRW